MATTTLSQLTRSDSFSDYIALTAYQANTLQSRADIARGVGSDTKIDTWFVPMPQQLTRITTHNYTTVETSLAYSLQKLSSPSGSRALPFNASTNSGTIGQLVNAAKEGLSSNNLLGQGAAVIGGQLGMKALMFGLSTVDMIRSVASMATDNKAIGMSNLELAYAGSIERSYDLSYDFVAKDSADIYGPTGVLTTIAQLEAYSFPKTFDDAISNRDLITVPPIWRMDHAVVGTNGSISVPQQSAPLAYLGQPKLLVLYNISAVHDTTSVAIDGNGNTYPLRTQLTLSFKEMEPVVRADSGDADNAVYGEISAPRLLCRSEVYTLE